MPVICPSRAAAQASNKRQLACLRLPALLLYVTAHYLPSLSTLSSLIPFLHSLTHSLTLIETTCRLALHSLISNTLWDFSHNLTIFFFLSTHSPPPTSATWKWPTRLPSTSWTPASSACRTPRSATRCWRSTWRRMSLTSWSLARPPWAPPCSMSSSQVSALGCLIIGFTVILDLSLFAGD